MMALIIAVAMVLGMTSMAAFAAGETNNRTLDGTINVTGLEAGDTVEFFRVLKFDQDAGSTGGWVLDTGFTGLETTDAARIATIQKMLGLGADGKPAADVASNPGNYGIDETLAARIGDLAESATAKYNASSTPAVAYSDSSATPPVRTASVTAPDDGLYIAIIHPGQAGTIYNPVFVGADYNQPQSGTDPSSNWTVDISDSYSPASMAKKGKVTLDKTATSQTLNNADNSGDHKTVEGEEAPVVETVNVGDKVSFVVDTTIPEFANSYTSARFKITDAVSEGLVYNADATVYVVTSTTVEGVTTEVETPLTASDTTFTNTTTTGNVGGETANTGYVIDFKSAWLLNQGTATKIRVKYSATVTTEAPTSINIEKNTVTVNYSNGPTDETGKGILKDETKHYTFDIDANLLGDSDYPATEVVKVGLDKDGKEITETVTLPGHTNPYGPLQGAEFVLYRADSASATKIKNEAGEEIKASIYTNTILKEGYKIVSDANGRLTVYNKVPNSNPEEWEAETTPGIRGLDAGTYYLVETQAPDGYIKAQNGVKVEINATITDVDVTEYYDETTNTFATAQNQAGTLVEVKYSVPTLASYEVKINGKQTANYTMTNERPNKGDLNDPAANAIGEDGLIGAQGAGQNADAGKITNTQGTELPSTGGIGTTIFYVVGAILVIGAGVILVTKRRMDA